MFAHRAGMILRLANSSLYRTVAACRPVQVGVSLCRKEHERRMTLKGLFALFLIVALALFGIFILKLDLVPILLVMLLGVLVGVVLARMRGQ